MCIAIFSTAHPDYSLIIIDNRDEYILRPTSRPHWWTHSSGAQVLSSRDLQRAEQGTWLAVTKSGDFAVLTNYQELVDESSMISTTRSRGGMPSLWVGSGGAAEPLADRVQSVVKDDGVKGVGGFSMICGRLRKNPESISIISNRASHVDDVPTVTGERGKTWGLSNTTYADPEKWPKVIDAEKLVHNAIQEAESKQLKEEEFVEALFTILDRDTLPPAGKDEGSVQDGMKRYRHSIFLRPVGTPEQKAEFAESAAKGRVGWDQAANETGEPPANPLGGYSTGLYGTQRQTVILVDLQGNVTYIERALFDPNGNEIKRGEGDETIRFAIDGWEN
ncbi:hypothetical protein PWT90_05986 [Aphanocladium album]|nr:hypothetical protein PWT90_05986 [Aphanocladium album]